MHEKGAFTSIRNAFAICLSDSALSIFESQGLVPAVIEEAQLNAQNFTFSSMIFHLLSHTTLPTKIRRQERSGILWKKCCTVVIALW